MVVDEVCSVMKEIVLVRDFAEMPSLGLDHLRHEVCSHPDRHTTRLANRPQYSILAYHVAFE